MRFKYTLREWQQLYKDPSEFIIQASSMNSDDGWMPWPIGMSWQYVLNFTKNEKLQQGSHINTVMCAITVTTDKSRRPSSINRESILQTLKANMINNTLVNHNEYFEALPSYKFVISPEGNGIDCHRHYEALMAGCIPIIEHNDLTYKKYEGSPIVWTTDYSKITIEHLDSIYEDMLDIEYDFSCLFLSNYTIDMQSKIKESGNFWLQRIKDTQCSWY